MEGIANKNPETLRLFQPIVRVELVL